MTFQLRDKVRGRGVEGIVSAIFLNRSDDMAYVLRTNDGLSYYCEANQLELIG